MAEIRHTGYCYYGDYMAIAPITSPGTVAVTVQYDNAWIRLFPTIQTDETSVTVVHSLGKDADEYTVSVTPGSEQGLNYYITGKTRTQFVLNLQVPPTEDVSFDVLVNAQDIDSRVMSFPTITAGTTSVDVVHNLDKATNEYAVSVTPHGEQGLNFYITNKTTTQFTLNLQVAPISDVDFDVSVG